jgi:phage-related protein
MAVGTFTQTISLEGAEEVKRQLEELGQAGAKALETFNKSVTATEKPIKTLNEGVSNTKLGFGLLSTATNTLGTALGPLVGQVGALGTAFAALGRGGIALGLAAVSGGIIALAKSTADSVVQLKDQAAALGLSVQQLQALQKATAAAGLDTDKLTGALTRFAGKVEGEAQEQFKALVDLAKEASAVLGGGKIRNVTVDEFLKLRDAVAQVAPQLKEMFKAAGDPLGILPIEQFREAILKVAQSSTETGQKVRELIRATGVPAPAIERLEKLDDLIKKNSGSLTAFGIALRDATGERPPHDVLLETLDKLRALPDGFQKTALAAQFFGRAVGPELVQALSRGGIEAAVAKLREAGLLIDESLIQNAIKARQAFKDFSQSSTDLQQNLGRLVLPSVTEFLEKINNLFSGKTPITPTGFSPLRLLFGDKPFDFLDSIISGAVEKFKNLFNLLRPALADMWRVLQTDGARAWQQITGTAQQAWDFIVQQAQAMPGRIQAAFASLGGIAAQIWESIKQAASAAWTFIVQQAQSIPGRIVAALAGFAGIFAPAWEAIKQSAQQAWDAIVQQVQTIPDRIASAISGLSSSISQIWEPIKQAAQQAWDFIVNGARQMVSQMAAIFFPLTEAIVAPFKSAADAITAILRGILDKIRDVIQGASSAQGAVSEIGEGGGGGFAGGGLVRGSGSSTSDSILARLSNGEFVIRSAAVKHFGVDFFRALNALRHPRFSMGGLVDGLSRNFAIPGLATGGLVAGPAGPNIRTAITLVMPGGQKIGGLFGTDTAVAQLKREAVLQQVISAGRKPNWVR